MVKGLLGAAGAFSAVHLVKKAVGIEISQARRHGAGVTNLGHLVSVVVLRRYGVGGHVCRDKSCGVGHPASLIESVPHPALAVRHSRQDALPSTEARDVGIVGIR